jgi:hypothetical protein
MTTWTWTCLLDDASGTAPDHDAAVAAAQEHNTQAEHDSPAISYGHDASPPDPAPAQWRTVDSVRGAQIRQTDHSQPPFVADMPQGDQDAFTSYASEWKLFRRSLNAIKHTGDPAALVWPTLPPAPTVVITPPPSFTDSSSWGDNWIPAP